MEATVKIHWRAMRQIDPPPPIPENQHESTGQFADFRLNMAHVWQRTPLAGETIHIGTMGWKVDFVEWAPDGSPILYLETVVDFYEDEDAHTARHLLIEAGFKMVSGTL